jgi:predicted nucleotide-binding protein
MENIEPTILIQKFRLANSTGVRALKDFSNKPNRRIFLSSAKNTLRRLFGSQAPLVKKYYNAFKNYRNITEAEYKALFDEFTQIFNYLEFTSGVETVNPRSQVSSPPSGANVFIIHGHDEINTLRLKNLLKDQFGFNSVLMKDKPGKSQSLLEKYEQIASTCSFAFSLMTPDDEITNHEQPYFQARPNVIFESGWFVGRLGVPRICLLLKKGTIVHSDIDGISRIYFNDNIEDKVIEIQRELEAVGLLNKSNRISK